MKHKRLSFLLLVALLLGSVPSTSAQYLLRRSSGFELTALPFAFTWAEGGGTADWDGGPLLLSPLLTNARDGAVTPEDIFFIAEVSGDGDEFFTLSPPAGVLCLPGGSPVILPCKVTLLPRPDTTPPPGSRFSIQVTARSYAPYAQELRTEFELVVP